MKELEISPELQIEINRAKWIQALRENVDRQCSEFWFRGELACAQGIVFNTMGIYEDDYADLEAVQTFLGLGDEMWERIAVDNDNGWTFAQIADAAEQGRYWDV